MCDFSIEIPLPSIATIHRVLLRTRHTDAMCGIIVNNMARVSVIISTYNRKNLLKRAIKSVLNQSMSDFELIVVDDCSKDTKAVENLVSGFGDPRISFYRTTENSGHDGKPKNIGIKMAKGEYVAFLDDDDVWRQDALKILLAYAENTQADVVYGDYLIDGKPGWSVDFSPSRLSQQNFISMDVAMTRRSALLAVGGFDEDVPKLKDWNLWLRLQKNGARFMHVPIIITEVSVLEDSVSNRFEVEHDQSGAYKPTFFNPADCPIYPDHTSLGTRKPLKVAVYTLTMNRLEYTKRMSDAMCRLAGYQFDWFVIDQGSNDGTQDFLNAVRLLWNGRKLAPSAENGWCNQVHPRYYEQNMGLAKGWNNILDWIKSEGGYDIVVKLDNDAEMLTEGWLAAMVDIFERNRKVVLSPYVEGLDGTPGGVMRTRASGDSPYMLINDHVLGIVPHLGGIVYAHPIELVKEWKFDEQAVGNKDVMLSAYARQNGYALFYMEEYRVWHIDGTAGQHKKFPLYFEELTPKDLAELELTDTV